MVSAEHQPSLGRTVLSLSGYQVVGVTVWAVRIWSRLVPGGRAELKPNVQIFIAGATRDPGGTLEASRVTVGKDDIPPPM